MIFGFGKRKEEEEEEEEDVDLVSFQGALNGQDPNLGANARLVEAGLVPAKEMVTDGLSRRAGVIRLEPKGERSAATFVIDGMAYPGERYSKQEGMAITQMLKLLAGLDTKERKRSQSGGIKAEFNGEPYELQINSVAMEGGERLTIKASNLKVKLDTMTDLGASEKLKGKLRDLGPKKGLLAVAGPPGSGITTTSYALIRSLDAYIYQLFTVGDTGNRKLTNITAFKSNEGDDLDKTVQRLFRIDADVIMLDPLKDEAAAKTIFKFHEECAFLTEFAAKDAVSGVAQLVKWVGDPQLVSQGLNGILSQKLMRLLCSECREAYRPNPQFLTKAGLPKDTSVLYRKPKDEETEAICSKCGGSGYFGRMAIFELLEMSDDMRKLVAANVDGAELRRQMRKEDMLGLQQDGLRLVAEGKTSLEELQRVFKTP